MPDEDPCVRLERLRSVREALISGQAVSETAFGEDRVRFAKADLPALEREIAEADRACALRRGQVRPRRRFAMGVRFRPH